MSAASTTFRPRRSVLYMPSSNAKALEKAKTLAIDGVILDLEDSVAPDAKPSARDAACAAVASGEYGKRELTIRVNSLGTEWHDADLAAACAAGPDGIVVPKVNSAGEVRQLVAAMEAAGAPEHTKLWAMVETPEAIFNVRELAAASDRNHDVLTAFVHVGHGQTDLRVGKLDFGDRGSGSLVECTEHGRPGSPLS